jgi:hypothetical protein
MEVPLGPNCMLYVDMHKIQFRSNPNREFDLDLTDFTGFHWIRLGFDLDLTDLTWI